MRRAILVEEGGGAYKQTPNVPRKGTLLYLLLYPLKCSRNDTHAISLMHGRGNTSLGYDTSPVNYLSSWRNARFRVVLQEKPCPGSMRDSSSSPRSSMLRQCCQWQTSKEIYPQIQRSVWLFHEDPTNEIDIAWKKDGKDNKVKKKKVY